MTSILADPVAPNPLPARRADMAISTDIPTEGATRPFGLTRATPLGAGEAMVSLKGATYDPGRQVSVDPGGRPFVETPGVIHAGTSYDTQYDMQWFVDGD
ncbi:putative ATP-grasp-modified RiPP [Saccharopolyspora sp. NPDC002376]